jgi:hypothetical protein
MGHVRTTLTLGNPSKPDLKPVEVSALVDTGALTLCITEHVALQLGLQLVVNPEFPNFPHALVK